jgi:SNF2 family DNA or RNA helicase
MKNLNEKWKHGNPTSRSCIDRSKLSLRNHQKTVVNYFKDHQSLVVVHGVGTGKTLTAVTATQCYLDANPGKHVVIIAPASLISNFKKELVAYGAKQSSISRYDMYSYSKFMRMEKGGPATWLNCKNHMLVVDEAHNIRSSTSKGYEAVMRCAMNADKRMLLTATPYVNNFQDFIALINVAYGYEIVGPPSAGLQYSLTKKYSKENLDTVAELLYDKVDVVDSGGSSDFPKKIVKYFPVRMKPNYYKKYQTVISGEAKKIFANPKAFYNGHRRAVNSIGSAEYYSSKIKAMVPIIKKGKTLIFTNWIEFGVEPIKKTLTKNNISFREFSGRVGKDEKNEIVRDFNDDKFEALIITKSGAEGLDLKGVRSVIILEPVWTDAMLQQIIGRAVRYESHAHLKKDDRVVHVYKMVLIEPSLVGWEDLDSPSTSGDVLLYRIIDSKKVINDSILNMLKKISIL